MRLLHPQRFSDQLWPLMSVLEPFWTSAVGCNTYLTPPSSQGFAPHWDDIDAFILQVFISYIFHTWFLYFPNVDSRT